MKSLQPITILGVGPLLAGATVTVVAAFASADGLSAGGICIFFVLGLVLGAIVFYPIVLAEACRANLVRLLGTNASRIEWYVSLTGAIAIGYLVASLRQGSMDGFYWLAWCIVLISAMVRMAISVLPVNFIEVRIVKAPRMSTSTGKWPRVHLVQVMVLVAVIAISLRVPVWWAEAGLRAPDWWETYWREKPARDAWGSPVTIRVTGQDDLGSVLARFKAATARPGLRRGLWIYVDTGGLLEAGRTLGSPIGIDVDARRLPAREFLAIVLKPIGLACKLQDAKVMVTSEKSLDEPIDYGPIHGDVFCRHGERVPF